MQVNTSSGTGLVTQAQALTLPVSPQQLGEERGHVGTGLQGDAMMETLQSGKREHPCGRPGGSKQPCQEPMVGTVSARFDVGWF